MDIPSGVQSVLDIVFFISRIILPLLCLLTLFLCFVSHRRGRRPREAVVYLEDMLTGKHLPVMYWENSIGRSRSSDICIKDDNAISRDHAVLMRRDSGWYICDTNSKGGVYVNKKQIKDRQRVVPGDIISIGNTHLVLKRVVDVEREYEIYSDSDRKTAKAFMQKKVKSAPNPAGMLAIVTIVQIIMGLMLVFGTGKIVLDPLISMFALIAITWIFYGISRKAFHRVSFEIETVGLMLSSIGVMMLTGKDMVPDYTHIIGLCIGIIFYMFLIWFMKDLDRTMKIRIAVGIAALVLFAINLVLGTSKYGARNWIMLGPLSFQPSEFIKIAYIFVGASTLNKLQTTRNLGAFLIFTALCMGALILMKDFGSAAVFFVTFLIIAFMRSGSFRTIILIIAAVALGAFLAVTFVPHIASRFATWRHVWEFADGDGWQQASALMYAASGGMFGLGLGNGFNIKTIFAGDSDIIFASICEELGLSMGIVILLSFVLLILMARGDVTRSRSTFYSICGCASAGLLMFQAMLNIFGTTDLLPFTGVTLPFISAGGTSIIAVWGLMSFNKAADERTYAASAMATSEKKARKAARRQRLEDTGELPFTPDAARAIDEMNDEFEMQHTGRVTFKGRIDGPFSENDKEDTIINQQSFDKLKKKKEGDS